MRVRHLFLALLAFGVSFATARAVDAVRLNSGTTSRGKITDMSPTEVQLELGQTKRKFSVNDIDYITYDGEPNTLNQARQAVRSGRYQDAINLLTKIDPDAVKRPEINLDVEYFRALAQAKQALAGNGSKNDAGKKLVAVERAGRNNYHYFEICELLGDLLTAVEKYDQAESFYNKLAQAPWNDYKMRAALFSGRALLGQKQFDKANTRFDEVLAMDANGKEADRQKLTAMLGKAAALAGNGKTDQATKSVEDIISRADPENMQLQAQAYNILGNTYRAAGRTKEAILAYLHVDLIYPRFPDQHAEALANLAQLWPEVGDEERAAETRAQLKQKYPESSWAGK